MFHIVRIISYILSSNRVAVKTVCVSRTATSSRRRTWPKNLRSSSGSAPKQASRSISDVRLDTSPKIFLPVICMRIISSPLVNGSHVRSSCAPDGDAQTEKKSVVLQTGLENVPQESYAHVLTVMPSFHFFRLCVFFFSLLPPHLERPIPISTRDVSRRGIIEFYTKGVFITNDSSGLRLFPHSGLIDVTFPSSTCARVRFCPFPTATCAVSLFIRVILSFRCIKFSFENEKARRLGAGTLVALVPLLMYYNPLLTLVKTGDVRLIPRPFVFISRCFTAPQLEFSRAVLSRSGLTVADRSNRTPFIIKTDYNEHPRLSGVYITYHV